MAAGTCYHWRWRSVAWVMFVMTREADSLQLADKRSRSTFLPTTSLPAPRPCSTNNSTRRCALVLRRATSHSQRVRFSRRAFLQRSAAHLIRFLPLATRCTNCVALHRHHCHCSRDACFEFLVSHCANAVPTGSSGTVKLAKKEPAKKAATGTATKKAPATKKAAATGAKKATTTAKPKTATKAATTKKATTTKKAAAAKPKANTSTKRKSKDAAAKPVSFFLIDFAPRCSTNPL